MVFDHDMTIVDSSYAIMAGFNYVARHEGLPEVSHDLTMKYIATPIPTFCEGLLGEYRPEWVKLYRSCSEKYERELIKPFEDTIPTLIKLREMGIKLAVISNREYPQKVLERTGLYKYFDVAVGALEPYGKLEYKPNPAMMNALLAHLNISPEDTVYIGDADIDVLFAEASGVRPIGISKGNFSREEFRLLGVWKSIDSLSELIDIANQDNLNAVH
ncbi:MAG: HAD-IA family hydrolase [Synergistaceae bacterium]|nr:HAD-IA family hydrolase [Synergistaceae bacterium]MBR0203094.1 HAD-IA family hydrolase [Synergistaceae bacterium]